MSEVDALLEIANAIKTLAGSIGSLSLVFWMILLFKNTSSDNSTAIREVANQLGKLLEKK